MSRVAVQDGIVGQGRRHAVLVELEPQRGGGWIDDGPLRAEVDVAALVRQKPGVLTSIDVLIPQRL